MKNCLYKECTNYSKDAIGYCSNACWCDCKDTLKLKKATINESTYQDIWNIFIKYRSGTVPYFNFKREIIAALDNYTTKILSKRRK